RHAMNETVRSPVVPPRRSSSSGAQRDQELVQLPERLAQPLAEADASSTASFEGWSSCRTSSVLPPFSSKVTVVTASPPSPSSLVQTRRECGVTSMYLPKNAMVPEAPWLNTKRYLPPTRTSASQESRD